MSPRHLVGGRDRTRRHIERGLTIYASAVFVLLWAGVVIAAFSDGRLLVDAWAWLEGLDTIAAIVVWIAILPIGVYLWAWQAELEPVLMGLVMIGLALWAAAAWSALVRSSVGRDRTP